MKIRITKTIDLDAEDIQAFRALLLATYGKLPSGRGAMRHLIRQELEAAIEGRVVYAHDHLHKYGDEDEPTADEDLASNYRQELDAGGGEVRTF